jgi:hypothetical protein
MSDDEDEDDGDKTPMDTKGKATKNDIESDEEGEYFISVTKFIMLLILHDFS